MVYVAQSQALAVLEVLVHLDSPDLLAKYVLLQVSFDSLMVAELDRSILPTNWRDDPAPITVQAIGEDWVLAQKSVALRVPSTLVPGESNFLLNPRHKDFKRLSFFAPISFQFDGRLVGKR
jgi:RES domain-containing protein